MRKRSKSRPRQFQHRVVLLLVGMDHRTQRIQKDVARVDVVKDISVVDYVHIYVYSSKVEET